MTPAEFEDLNEALLRARMALIAVSKTLKRHGFRQQAETCARTARSIRGMVLHLRKPENFDDLTRLK